MRVKHYQDCAHYLKKSWVKYPIPCRGRMLRRAAEMLGYPSYIVYLQKRDKKRWLQYIMKTPRARKYFLEQGEID